MSVHGIKCACSEYQPNPAEYRVESVWRCPSCHQTWTVRARRTGGGLGMAVPVGGVYVGGMRNDSQHYWARVGTNVGRKAALAAANLEAEEEYVRDVAIVRRIVARDPKFWAGLSVRRYRELAATSGRVVTWGWAVGQPKRIVYRQPTALEQMLASDAKGMKIRRWFPKSANMVITL